MPVAVKDKTRTNEDVAGFRSAGVSFCSRSAYLAGVETTLDENQPAFLRLFIALPVPAEVREEIGRAQGRLRREAPRGAVRWTRPEQFHVTLKFLGDFPSAQLEALKQAVSGACAGVAPMALAARGIGFFPNASKPRVLWAGASDSEGRLAELHRRIHAAVLPFAPADSSERFSSHITLGRFKPGRYGSLERFLECAEVLRSKTFGEWRADEVEIVRSILTPDGAEHASVCGCRLA